MKKLMLLFALSAIISNVFSQVAISTNGSLPDASAMLDVASTEKGLLIPRLTMAERDLVNLPAQGLLIYQTDNTPGFYFYDGSGWAVIGSESMNINGLTDGKTGGNSVFLGSGAGANNDGSDNQNVAVGVEALKENTSGFLNTATGYKALKSNTTGYYNTATGHKSLSFNTTGDYNTANGVSAMHANTTGHHNTANGCLSLYSNSTGSYNTTNGQRALYSNTTGNYNTANGQKANYFNEEGSNNTIMGFEAGCGTSLHNKSGNVLIGYRAGYYETGDNKLYIENSLSSSPLIYGEFTSNLLKFNGKVELANGSSASSLKFYEPSGSGTNFTKFQSQSQAGDVTYTLPAADGTNGQTLQTDGSGELSWNDDVGAAQINGLTDGKTGGNSIFLGSGAGANDDGSDNKNIAVGIDALNANTTGYNNTAMGHNALTSNITGMYNTANGYNALSNNTGHYNAAFGSEALCSNLNGYGNAAFGSNALKSNTTGNSNTAIGYFADYYNQGGNNNTIIGYEAGKGNLIHNRLGNIFLGYQAGFNETGDNKLYIENSLSSSPLIYGEFDNDLLKFNGAVELNNGSSASSLKFYEPSGSGTEFTKFQSQAQAADITYTLPADDGTSGQVLQTDGSGALSWNDDVGAAHINNLIDGKSVGCSVFLGSEAGYNDDGTFNTSVAVGIEALKTSTTGEWNTAIGYQTLFSSTENDNTAIGYKALYSNTTGSCNTANGVEANYYNGSGSNNTMIGYKAGRGSSAHNKSGNIFLGYKAGYFEAGDNKLYIENSNTLTPLIGGDFDADEIYLHGVVGIGTTSILERLHVTENNGATDGSDGCFALIQNTNTSTNVLSGIRFKNGTYSNTSKGGIFYRDMLSYGRGDIVFVNNSADSPGNATFADARMTIKNDGKVGIGTTVPGAELEVNGQVKITGGTPGASKVLTSDADGLASWQEVTGVTEINDLTDGKTGGNSVFLGSGAGANDDESDNRNVGVGSNALSANTTGDYNSANGSHALRHNTTGSYNTADGYMSLFNNTTESFNTADGYMSLFSNTTGQCNTATGSQALYYNTTGSHNTGNGLCALHYNTTGNYNTANGCYALCNNTTGQSNIATGYNALYHNTTGQYNTVFGYRADYYNQEGSNNTVIGHRAGTGTALHTKSGNIFLGYRAGFNETGDNKLYIENSDASSPLIYGEFDNDLITVYGNLGVGTKSFGGGSKTLSLENGTVPTSSNTNGVLLYSQDVSFSSELKVRDEAGHVTTLSPHNFSLINKSEPMAWSYFSENTAIGKKINVDMLRAVRLIEKMTGEKLAYVTCVEGDADNANIEANATGIIQQQQKEIDELKTKLEELTGLKTEIRELKTLMVQMLEK